MTQREAFEAWAKSQNLDPDHKEKDAWGRDVYSPHIHSMWCGWQAAQAQAAGASMEPVAWMRPSVTENGIVYDSSFRDENGMVLPETREEQGFERLYTAAAIAAARVQAINECADLITPPEVIKRIDGKSYSTAMHLANAIRALIGAKA